MDRAVLGSMRVADPLIETYRNLYATVEQKGWSDFNWDPVSYYHERMICNWLLQLIDNALSDAQLDAVRPAEVHRIVLLLFRDMFRHHAKLIRSATSKSDWVELLFEEIAKNLRLPAETIKDDGELYNIDIDERKNCEWANLLAAPFGLPALKLFVCHSAIVTGITEELGNGRCQESIEPSANKPWWKFW